VLLVREVEQRTKRDGSAFLRLTLADRSGTVPAVLWDADDAIGPGAPLRVRGRFAEHPRYGRQLTISDVAVPAADDVRWDDLVDGPPRPVSDLLDALDVLLASIEDAHLSTLLTRLVDRRFTEMPAAKFNHHAYRSGLLDHSLAVAQAVSAAAAIFPGIDRDLAVTGALLHDIGKLEAYTSEHGCIDFADAGRLEGEIPLGYYRVRREIEATPGFPPDRARALLHIVLSHHGCLEHGSPVVPSTREAALVHAMDNLSGQLGAFDRLEKETAPGEPWSRYDRAVGSAAFFGSPHPTQGD
jgi:3'-5' exoribonuclease